MKKTLKKLIAAACAVTMLGSTAGALVACGNGDDGNKLAAIKDGYNSYTIVMPSNWNELTYQDNNDTQIMNYLSSPLFEFDYEWDEAKGGKFVDGKINPDAIVDGGYSIQLSAAKGIKDVTDQYAEEWGITEYNEATDENEFATANHCFEIELRTDLKWDDGTAIKAEDFVYTMKEQLDPKFAHYRANSYYQNVALVGAKNYFNQGKSGWFAAKTPYDDSAYTATLDEALIFTMGSSDQNSERGGAVNFIRNDLETGQNASYFTKDLTAEQIVSKAISGYGFSGVTVEQVMSLEGKTMKQIKEDATLTANFNAWAKSWYGVGLDEAPELALYFTLTNYTFPEMDFEDVGFFVTGDYKFVACFTDAYHIYNNDDPADGYSYHLAYELSSFPLVKRSLYETTKKEPGQGETLWTTNYNSSLATTASWGPYKLTSFQSGKSYTLERNEYWYGYNMEQYKDQYLVTKINCEKIAEKSTQWMSFLSGRIDEIGIDVEHKDDYRNSKYAISAPGSTTFSVNVFSDLEVLKNGDRNNTILAIKEFRKALSLGMNRDDYNSRTTTAHQSAYGYLNDLYYHDIENKGVYRYTDQGKKALLRAYGYVENNGKWSLESNAQIRDLDLDEAYDTLKGYDIEQARQLVDEAYDIMVADKEKYGYDSSKKIQIKYGTGADNEGARLDFNYLSDMLDNIVKGTKLEGKIEFVFDASFGDAWYDEFVMGNYDWCGGGWGGMVFDPFGLMEAYINPEKSFTPWWDTSKEFMTFNLPGTDPDQNYLDGESATMSVLNWWNCLCGKAATNSQPVNKDFSGAPIEYKLELLAKLEEYALTQYYCMPTTSQNSASLLSAKYSYVADVYNTFMSYGGMQYLRVNYSYDEWKQYVSDHKNDLSSEYKKTE